MPLVAITLARREPATSPENEAERIAGVTALLGQAPDEWLEDVVVLIEALDPDGWGQGGPDEDTSGGFPHGGWIGPYADPVQSAVIRRQMSLPFDLLLGRRTFEIWAPYWPVHPEIWPEVQRATKYVASNTLTSHAWGPSVFLGGDIAGRVAELKRQPGPDLHLYGSANLLQTLLAHDLVDALWLRIHPITLGRGKRLFDERVDAAGAAALEGADRLAGDVHVAAAVGGDPPGEVVGDGAELSGPAEGAGGSIVDVTVSLLVGSAVLVAVRSVVPAVRPVTVPAGGVLVQATRVAMAMPAIRRGRAVGMRDLRSQPGPGCVLRDCALGWKEHSR